MSDGTAPQTEPTSYEPTLADEAPATEVAPAAEAPAEATAPVTSRQLMGITGEVRVGAIQINLGQAQCAFTIEEGVKSDDGFLPTRVAGNCQVTGPDYAEFLAEVAPALTAFLKRKMVLALDQPPAQIQQ